MGYVNAVVRGSSKFAYALCVDREVAESATFGATRYLVPRTITTWTSILSTVQYHVGVEVRAHGHMQWPSLALFQAIF